MADEPIDLAPQARMLGVPDPTLGQPVINTSLPPIQPGDTIDMTGGTAPAFVPDRPLGQVALPPAAAVPSAKDALAPIDTGVVAPPGPQTITTKDQHVQTQLGLKVDPELRKQMLKAQGDEVEAKQAETATVAVQQDAIAKAQVEQQRLAEEARLANEKAAEARKAKAAEYLTNVQNAQAELDKQEPPTEGFGVKFANSIGLLLSGLGKMLGGQSNVEQVIENNRAQRMNAWRAEFARRQGKVASAQNMYAMFRQKGLDDVAAEAATSLALNRRYENVIKSEIAANASEVTRAQGAKAIAQLQQQNVASQLVLDQQAQNRSTIVSDTKSVTKDGAGGGSEEDRGRVMKQADDNKEIASYRENRNNLRRFSSMVKAGASEAALADFIANTMKQGSYTPSTFNDALKKRSLLGKTAEQLRAAWSGGVPPDLLRDIGTSLVLGTNDSKKGATKAVRYFSGRFEQLGIPKGVLLGDETDDEAERAAGFKTK